MESNQAERRGKAGGVTGLRQQLSIALMVAAIAATTAGSVTAADEVMKARETSNQQARDLLAKMKPLVKLPIAEAKARATAQLKFPAPFKEERGNHWWVMPATGPFCLLVNFNENNKKEVSSLKANVIHKEDRYDFGVECKRILG